MFLFASGSASASVGRQASSDLALDWDDQVSRLHARFELEDVWVLVDDGMSTNGTFVNGERLRGRRRLSDGDSLRFGTTTVTFRSPTPKPAPSQPDEGEPRAAIALSTTQRRVLTALCRPYKGREGFASPAGDEQIAEALFLSVGEVRAHLRVLEAKLGVPATGHSDARVRLVQQAFSAGLVSERDL